MDRAKLREQLVLDEGLRTAAYKDTTDHWTIGVGHLLGKDTGTGPRVKFITVPEAMAWLEADIDIAERAVNAVFPEVRTASVATLNVRYRALINMAFNRGEKNMRESTTITPAIKAALVADIDHDIAWNKVSAAILASPWGKQIGRRAERLAYMFSTGKDPQ